MTWFRAKRRVLSHLLWLSKPPLDYHLVRRLAAIALLKFSRTKSGVASFQSARRCQSLLFTRVDENWGEKKGEEILRREVYIHIYKIIRFKKKLLKFCKKWKDVALPVQILPRAFSMLSTRSHYLYTKASLFQIRLFRRREPLIIFEKKVTISKSVGKPCTNSWKKKSFR